MSCKRECVTPTPSQAHCGACHETFSGVSLFDAHRYGPLDSRQCLPTLAMMDQGHPIAHDARGVARSTRSREPQTRENASGVGTGRVRHDGRS